ncbi:uncharacterized protein LOC108739972 isoform X2 [Agrilus planipennis]|uniref:Uncharacterized protein LOC108739972 isoform X2 n=1 Tax=Agrilus planipennis TaxID=224129 RepID=A0A1W4X0F1_AGRPL|nr:uncharacterized protein LOC108739972 isoform X2 [Agrilus planipennis]
MNRNRQKGKFKLLDKYKAITFFWLCSIILCSIWYGFVTHKNSTYYKIESEIADENRITDANSKENTDYGDVEVNNFMGLKIVHLDLKGAPPKISYFKQLFPLLASLGATGLLIEYEDMFPYYKTLANVSSLEAYSLKEIETVNKLAQLSNLLIIPLIPTIGKSFRFYFKVRRV